MLVVIVLFVCNPNIRERHKHFSDTWHHKYTKAVTRKKFFGEVQVLLSQDVFWIHVDISKLFLLFIRFWRNFLRPGLPTTPSDRHSRYHNICTIRFSYVGQKSRFHTPNALHNIRICTFVSTHFLYTRNYKLNSPGQTVRVSVRLRAYVV